MLKKVNSGCKNFTFSRFSIELGMTTSQLFFDHVYTNLAVIVNTGLASRWENQTADNGAAFVRKAVVR